MLILELIRYKNCAMAGLAAVIGSAIAYSIAPGEMIWMLLVFLTVFLVTGAGNAVNDYFDAAIDVINRPGRPIPSFFLCILSEKKGLCREFKRCLSHRFNIPLRGLGLWSDRCAGHICAVFLIHA